MKKYYTNEELEEKLKEYEKELVDSFELFEKTGEMESVLLFDISTNYADTQNFTKEDTQKAIDKFREEFDWNLNIKRISKAALNLANCVETFADLDEAAERILFLVEKYPHPNRTQNSVNQIIAHISWVAGIILAPKINKEK